MDADNKYANDSIETNEEQLQEDVAAMLFEPTLTSM